VILSPALKFVGRRLRAGLDRRPGLFFLPSPGLSEFASSDAKRILVIAANRTGKTYHAAKKLADRLISRVMRARMVGPTNKMVNQVHGRYLFRFLRDYLKEGCTWNPRTGFNGGNIIELKNGSICQLMSYEQTPDAHAGDDLDLVVLDEPPPPAIFMESEARVFSRDGDLWLTFTAVGRPVKWLKEIVLSPDSGWTVFQVALSPENVPWMSRKAVKARIKAAALTPWQFAQRILGAWDGVSDDRQLGAWSDKLLVPLSVGARQGWPRPGHPVRVVLAVDHGEGVGHSAWLLIGWQVVSRSAHGARLYIRILGEWSNKKRMSAQAEAEAVTGMILDAGVRMRDIGWAVGDINSAGKSSGAKSLNAVYEQVFAKIMKKPADRPPIAFRSARKGADSIEYGVTVLNQLFDADDLWISESCVELAEGCSHWQGKDDDLKHRIDALRYGVTAILEEEGAEPVALLAA
jgi:hypothetical protein